MLVLWWILLTMIQVDWSLLLMMAIQWILLISRHFENVVYGLIASTIGAGNLTDCAHNAAGGLIAATDDCDSTGCADISIWDNAADEFIATDDDNSSDFSDTNVLDHAYDWLMMLMSLLHLSNWCYGKWYDDFGTNGCSWEWCAAFWVCCQFK